MLEIYQETPKQEKEKVIRLRLVADTDGDINLFLVDENGEKISSGDLGYFTDSDGGKLNFVLSVFPDEDLVHLTSENEMLVE